MNTYKIVARPNLYFALPGRWAPLTEEVLLEALAGVAVRELRETQNGHQVVDVTLQRPSEAQALDEIISVLEGLGFTALEATVSEWVNELVERSAIGLLGGGAFGAALENGAVAIFAAAAGAIAGALSGAEAHKLKAEYEALRDHQGVWTFREIPTQPTDPLRRPGFSPA